jgi:hypothetical protein
MTAMRGGVANREAAGFAVSLLFVGLASVRDVYLGGLFQRVAPPVLALAAFSLCSAIFLPLALVRGASGFRALRGHLGRLAWVNVTTGLAWISFFHALRISEPMLVQILFAGVGPLSVEWVDRLLGRAPARLGILVVFFLAILAARGHATLSAALPRRARPALLVAISAVLLLEYWVAPLRLERFPNDPPPLYAWLATQPRGVVAEFPMPAPDALPGLEPRYAYMSTFHWMPTVNGYSGYYPNSYISRLDAMNTMPDDAAVAALLRYGVRYVIVHPDFYDAARRDRVLADISSSPRFAELGRFDDGLGVASVYRVR